jgi:HK97 family phage portal protein
MGILSRVFRPAGAAAMQPQATVGTAGPYSPLDPELAEFFGGGPTRSGAVVGADTAMRQSTVFACVRVLAEDVATLPLHLYRRTANGGRERATDHPLYELMHLRPNGWQTAGEWREMMQGHLELRGNAYARVTRYRGEVRELIPLHPDRMTVRQDRQWRVTYRYDGREIPAGEVLHLMGLSSDGVTGLSTITLQREAIGLAIATQDHGARLFGNGARPGGILEHPGTMEEAAQKRLKKSVEDATTGANQHRLLVLEEGMKWHQVGLTNEDAQFLETRKFQRSEIAGLFRVPPHMISDLERATFTNIEHQAIQYVTHALMGRLRRWEQRLNVTLLTPAERREFYFEHDPNALLRGDVKSRFDAYNVAVQGGWMNRNEVRVRENMNPEPGLDDYLVPLNMRGAGDEEA